MLVKRRITITGEGADAAGRQTDEREKALIFKNCFPFINCKTEINNTQIDNAKNIDIVKPKYYLTKYSDNYSKMSGSFLQYPQDEQSDNLTHSEPFKFIISITAITPADGNIKDAEIIVQLRHLNKFLRTPVMSLRNCKVNTTWSSNCVIINSTRARRFEITDTKLYVAVVTLSSRDNGKLPQQLKLGFKRTINWNKYQSDPRT